MSGNIRLFLLGACLLSAGNAFAQNQAKTLSQLLKVSFTAPKNIAANHLSTEQIRMLQSNYTALEETRRALYQNPGWAVSAAFKPVNENLRVLGMPLPAHISEEATRAEKERYRKDLDDLLYQESLTLGQILDQKPRPQTPAERLNWSSHFSQRQASSPLIWNAWVYTHPSATWGTRNWDEVFVKPFIFPSNPASPKYVPPEELTELLAKEMLPQYDLYSYILSRKKLSLQQKQLLIALLDEAAAATSYPFVQKYMMSFRAIPSVYSSLGRLPRHDKNRLEDFAVTLQKNLIRKLQEKGKWKQSDFEMFAEASIYLPPEKAKAVFAAVTYLEPKAALWLLDHPLNNPTSQHLLQEIQKVRANKKNLWQDGKILPKAETMVNLKRLNFLRLQAMNAYFTVLTERLNRLMEIEYSVTYSLQLMNDPNRISQENDIQAVLSSRIYLSANQARLRTLINQIELRLEKLGTEMDNELP